jgi:hypothetical protein
MVGQTLTFSVATGGGTPTSRLWTFGDGATASGSPVTHAYATLGAKTVSVTVSNAYGQATSNTTVTVVDTAQATLNSIADAYVQSDNPTANLNWESLITDGYRDHSPARGTTRDILIKFDLSPIPAGAAVTQARLRVYCSQDQNYASRCATLYVKRVLQDWVEGEVTWQNRTAGASWAGSAFAPGEGSNYDAAPAGFIEKHVGINWLGTVQDIDVTPLAQGWIGLGQANNGLVIQTYAAIGTTNILGPKRTDFSSRETANPPQLVVSYSMGGGSNAPPRILGLASVAGNTMRMSFEGVSGQVYRLFYTTGLVPTNWIPLGAVTSQGGTVSIDDAGAGAATQRYYRVSEQ